MSPVTRKSPDGLPIFYLKDIPPVAEGGPPITQPRVYFGGSDAGYAIVQGATPEFDYPKGSDNAYTTYDGADGVPIGGTAWRSLFAWYFDDLNILLSGYVTSQSKILFHRNIQDRVRMIAPFLQLDRDPYLVISEGRLYWIQDAYTVSDWFPYANPDPQAGGVNYIRNSVKILIDAYNGSVDFYVADAADPLVETYRKSSPLCSSRSIRCPRISDSTSATPKTSSPFRRFSIARITWRRPRCSIIARTSGNFRANQLPSTRTRPAGGLPEWRLIIS